MPPELKILYIWISSVFDTEREKRADRLFRGRAGDAATTASVVVLNGRIVKCRYTTGPLDGERWTSPKDYIEKHNLAPCSPVIERIEVF